MCIDASCSQPLGSCCSDPNVVVQDGGDAAACGVYATCVDYRFLTLLLGSDAGARGESSDLNQAQALCASNLPVSSITLGNQLIGCVASSCATQCVGQ
jgi:hypothetical protein